MAPTCDGDALGLNRPQLETEETIADQNSDQTEIETEETIADQNCGSYQMN